MQWALLFTPIQDSLIDRLVEEIKSSAPRAGFQEVLFFLDRENMR
jgi:hypothetical protein